MPINGKLEVTIKFTELPTDVETDKHGWKKFKIACGGHTVACHVRPRFWLKLEEASKNYPLWTAALTGTLGPCQGQDFPLLEPGIQIFERKPPAPPTPHEPPPIPEG